MFGIGKATKLRAVAFDVIGTTFPLEPLRLPVVAAGLPPAGLEGWFAAALRDAFALAAAGDFEPFDAVLEAALDGVLAEQGLAPPADQKRAILDGLERLPPRVGAAEAYAAARAAGWPVVALTNGARAMTEAMLERAGLGPHVSHVVSVDEVKRSKPAREVYVRAAEAAGCEPTELALVAAHPWDVNGADAAGLVTAYLTADRPFPRTMRHPDVEGATLPECVERLLAL